MACSVLQLRRRSRLDVLAVALTLLFACLWSVEAAAAEVRVDAVDVSLVVLEGGAQRRNGSKVARKRSWVEGTATYRLKTPATAGDELVLLDFAAFLAEDPVQLDEAAVAGYVNGRFDPGATLVVEHEGATSVHRKGPRRDLVATLQAGATELVLTYRVRVPSRP
ncbi:MAG: hypothetical protein AAGA54_36350, partial [Myxococcota bacterium]